MAVEKENTQNNSTSKFLKKLRASKIEVFQLTKEIFPIFGLVQDQYIFRRPFNQRGLLLLCMHCLSITSYSSFLFFEANTFNQYADSAFMTFAVISACAVYLICVWDRKPYLKLMICLETVVNNRLAYPSSKSIYITYNRYVNIFSKWMYIGLVKMVPIGTMSPLLIFSYFSYYITDLGKDAFILPFPMWFPFDWKTPTSYLVAFVVEHILITCASIAAVLASNSGVGTTLISIAMAKDVKADLCSICARVENYQDQSQLVIDFKDFLRFSSESKQHAVETSETYKPITAGVLSVNILLICPVLLMIQIELSQDDLSKSMDLAILFFQVIGAFFFLSIACEFGERLRISYDEIDDVMLQLSWYNFPCKVKKILPIFISITQKEVALKGLGSVLCSRETFKQIIKGGFSYFMTLRQLY